MAAKTVVTGEESRQTILHGVNTIADAVKMEEPLRQIVANAGEDGAIVLARCANRRNLTSAITRRQASLRT
jgi:chaperonin GroEL (HSP60 family)